MLNTFLNLIMWPSLQPWKFFLLSLTDLPKKPSPTTIDAVYASILLHENLQWKISGRGLITSIYTHCHRAINQADIKKNAVEFHDWLKAGDTFKETNNVLKFSQVSVTHITLLPKVIYLGLTVLQLLLNGHHCLVGLTG